MSGGLYVRSQTVSVKYILCEFVFFADGKILQVELPKCGHSCMDTGVIECVVMSKLVFTMKSRHLTIQKMSTLGVPQYCKPHREFKTIMSNYKLQ